MNTTEFFAKLWAKYVAMAPQAEQISGLFTEAGEAVINDHVAFRTFNHPSCNIAQLEPLILSLGYQVFDEYEFPNKHLQAKAFIHQDLLVPKIFLSELIVQELSASAQRIISRLTPQIDTTKAVDHSVFWAGRLWPIVSHEEYEQLLAESEYAGWLAVHGLCANHFTVNVNQLTSLDSVAAVLEYVKAAGFEVNTSGGEVKGGPDVCLAQGSTMADQQLIEFANGDSHPVRTCFYEFAERFPQESGDLYQGFVAASADKLFESTHR